MNLEEIEILECIECTNGSIDIRLQNGVRMYGKLQTYPITVKKKYGEYKYSDNSMFSPDNWLNPEEKQELTEYIEDRFNISIQE